MKKEKVKDEYYERGPVLSIPFLSFNDSFVLCTSIYTTVYSDRDSTRVLERM